jgi:hypothetical protein
MSQGPTDISLDALLRALERHYAHRAAGLFRANRIPEPLDCRIRRGRNLRLALMFRRANLIQLPRSNRAFHNSQRKRLSPGPIPFLSC